MKKLLPAALAAAAALAASAETNETAKAELPPVVVEASRLGKTPGEMPAAVQVIDRDAIARSGARDVVDLLEKKSAALDFAHLGGCNPALAQIAPRGYGENGFGRLLVVVDGERLNSPDMNAPNLAQVSLGAVKRVEILQGSQNVLHGDAASAGVVNIVTDPDDYATHGHVELHGGSWNTIGASASLRGGVEDTRTQYWANGGWDHSDGYRHDSGYDAYSAGGGVRQNFEGGSYLRLSAFYSDVDSELPGYLSRAQWKHHPTASDGYGDHYRRTTYGANATAYGVIDEDNALRLVQTLSRRHLQSRGYGYWHTDYDVYSYAFTPEWINTTKIGALDNELVAGATFRYDRNDAANWGTSAWGSSHAKYEYDRQTMGFYAQDTLHVTDSLALEVGGRYERSWNKCTMAAAPTRVYDLAAYDAALLFTPFEGFKSYVKYSSFYRLPFIDEVAYHSRDDLLSPERGWRVDAGFDWSPAADLQLAGNAYVSRTKHEIFYNPLFPYSSFGYPAFGDNVNSPSPVMREGFDLRASWERDKVAGVSLAYSFVDASFDGGEFDDNDVPMAARSVVSASGRVWLWDECFAFGGYRYRTSCRSTSDFAGAYDKLPGFGLFHAGVQYSPTRWRLDGLTFSLTVDNLFDKNYCDYSTYGSSYWPGAGRSYMFSVRYEF
ncbi:MAG: TonB-dependent receptor [Kiritimatiellae bacterium]|nr:TonB-dependent receptor [Kiritimatiellia bacterium]